VQNICSRAAIDSKTRCGFVRGDHTCGILPYHALLEFDRVERTAARRLADYGSGRLSQGCRGFVGVATEQDECHMQEKACGIAGGILAACFAHSGEAVRRVRAEREVIALKEPLLRI
jgi:hypothetical protein